MIFGRNTKFIKAGYPAKPHNRPDRISGQCLPKMFGDGEHDVGGGDVGIQSAGYPVAHHLRQGHGDGLAQHDGLGLDSAHAPADHAQTVDHGGVTVCAHHTVGVQQAVLVETNPGQVFQVHLESGVYIFIFRHSPLRNPKDSNFVLLVFIKIFFPHENHPFFSAFFFFLFP